MTSDELRKKFLACRQYKLRGVDQVEWEKQSPLNFKRQIVSNAKGMNVCGESATGIRARSTLSGGASGWRCGLNVRLSQGVGDSDNICIITITIFIIIIIIIIIKSTVSDFWFWFDSFHVRVSTITAI